MIATTTAASVLPTLTTTSVSSITQITAISGGNISNDGGAAITAKGVCWSTNSNPTIALTTKTTNGTGTGVFTSNIAGLTAGTTYYIRAYATNSVGTAYGNQVSFTTLQSATGINGPNVTDIDGNTYQSVTNCGLTFTKQNLIVSKYSDGTPIPEVTSPTAWENLTTGAWCYYANNATNEPIYGKLYNWYAVAGIYDAASAANPALRKKLAPTGWHVPTDPEWTQLTDCLGGNFQNAGGKMKSIGSIEARTGLWISPNTKATNESGFSGIPGGIRFETGSFTKVGLWGNWWSSSESSIGGAWSRKLSYDDGGAYSFDADIREGFSVRCVKD